MQIYLVALSRTAANQTLARGTVLGFGLAIVSCDIQLTWPGLPEHSQSVVSPHGAPSHNEALSVLKRLSLWQMASQDPSATCQLQVCGVQRGKNGAFS